LPSPEFDPGLTGPWRIAIPTELSRLTPWRKALINIELKLLREQIFEKKKILFWEKLFLQYKITWLLKLDFGRIWKIIELLGDRSCVICMDTDQTRDLQILYAIFVS
jgi:hypothetical protein